MDGTSVLDLLRESTLVMMKMAGPVLLVTLAIGFVISLIQAMTQIQEATLSFIPKLLGVFFTLLFFLPYIFNSLSTFTEKIFDQITKLT